MMTFPVTKEKFKTTAGVASAAVNAASAASAKSVYQLLLDTLKRVFAADGDESTYKVFTTVNADLPKPGKSESTSCTVIIKVQDVAEEEKRSKLGFADYHTFYKADDLKRFIDSKLGPQLELLDEPSRKEWLAIFNKGGAKPPAPTTTSAFGMAGAGIGAGSTASVPGWRVTTMELETFEKKLQQPEGPRTDGLMFLRIYALNS